MVVVNFIAMWKFIEVFFSRWILFRKELYKILFYLYILDLFRQLFKTNEYLYTENIMIYAGTVIIGWSECTLYIQYLYILYKYSIQMYIRRMHSNKMCWCIWRIGMIRSKRLPPPSSIPFFNDYQIVRNKKDAFLIVSVVFNFYYKERKANETFLTSFIRKKQRILYMLC